ncbi:YbaN family protein [Gordonia rhizosphera]|uniref:Inner membrane protein n=1 Tax=Gordonia rhizosphera NBRC 16068 TaxID=1108045 RepID=K6WDA5_9ACTN|nr:YbaN family protein [Gordonia rhizosphera]GAB91711.1 hypothetical protein GORHZ_141_00870 [Gordonia rhizosphera NBRC 16068]
MCGWRGIRWAWWLLAYLSLAVGLIGIVLPLLPTVPFVLLSAFAASRGSDRLQRWLHEHPSFGPLIRDWEHNHTVARRAKWLASIMMTIASVILAVFTPHWAIWATSTAIMAVVATWLWLRPEPESEWTRPDTA